MQQYCIFATTFWMLIGLGPLLRGSVDDTEPAGMLQFSTAMGSTQVPAHSTAAARSFAGTIQPYWHGR